MEQIKLEARTFVNPWGREMRDVYVVSLTAAVSLEDDLVALCALVNAEPRWHSCWSSAQLETLGRTVQDDTVTYRYLVGADQYNDFKATLGQVRERLRTEGSP